jgi:phosphate transport system permease protein
MSKLPQTDWFSDEMQERTKKRHRRNQRFKRLGFGGVLLALAILAALLGGIVVKGIDGFRQTQIAITVGLDAGYFGDISGEQLASGNVDVEQFRKANYGKMVRTALMDQFPGITKRGDIRQLNRLVSVGAKNQLRMMVMAQPSLIGSTVQIWAPANADVDSFAKGGMVAEGAESDRRLSDQQIDWIRELEGKGALRTVLSGSFFSTGDSREPELAGIWGAVVGSALTLLVTLLVSLPLGVAAAIYLEEFARKGRWSDWIEVNINNLAAVPSIVYGLLGLAIFLNFFGLPRSAPIVGGLTLAMMTLPTIIIAGRVALAAVPPSIRDAAMGLGASKTQVTFDHILPLALPGILTGSIIGMARALGETAPLLMIGMVAFVVDVPGSFSEPATVLPVQVFLWADRPEPAFIEKASAAILVLLGFLLVMNGVAIYLRNKFEKKW